MSTVSIRAEAIARRFADEQAVAGVDLEIWVGEIVALVGLNGAGNTTLMRLLLGMLRPDRRTADVLGCPVADADRAVWSRVGHLIETPPRYGELTVAESVYSAARLQGWDRRSARVATAAIIADLELEQGQHRATRTLSQGNRQRLGIATALVHQPDVLVLDEPSDSLDPLGVVRVRQLLGAARRGGCSSRPSSERRRGIRPRASCADARQRRRGRSAGVQPASR